MIVCERISSLPWLRKRGIRWADIAEHVSRGRPTDTGVDNKRGAPPVRPNLFSEIVLAPGCIDVREGVLEGVLEGQRMCEREEDVLEDV